MLLLRQKTSKISIPTLFCKGDPNTRPTTTNSSQQQHAAWSYNSYARSSSILIYSKPSSLYLLRKFPFPLNNPDRRSPWKDQNRWDLIIKKYYFSFKNCVEEERLNFRHVPREASVPSLTSKSQIVSNVWVPFTQIIKL